MIFGAHLFKELKMLDSQQMVFPKFLFSNMSWDDSYIFKSILVSPKIDHIGFGSRGHVQKSRTHGNDGFRFLEISRKVTSPK